MMVRRILAALALLCLSVAPLHAQKTKAAITTEIPLLCPAGQTTGACTATNAQQLWSDIVNAIMPTAPVVSGNLACFNGTTGLLRDCGSSPSGTGLTVGTSVVSGGTAGRPLYDNSGVLGEYAQIPVANGGTGLASGTSGGVLCFTGSTTISSSAGLNANGIMLGGGTGSCPASLGSLGTGTTVLHGNPSGIPQFLPVAIGTDVSGLGTGVGTLLGNNATGSGAPVGGTGPAISGPTITGTVTGTYTLSGSVTFPAGGGTGTFKPFGMLQSIVNAVGTGADTTEDTLQTYSLPANTFGATATQKGLRITAWGNFAADNNSKTVRLYFGTTAIFTSTALTQNGTTWRIEAFVFDQGNGVNQYQANQGLFGTAVITGSIAQLSQTETSPITIKVTGQNGSAIANEIVCYMLQIEMFNF